MKSNKETRHTCIVCSKKRYESRMKIVKEHCHTGLPQWACNVKFNFNFYSRTCREKYNSPG